MVPASATLMDDGATYNIRGVCRTSTERPMGHCRLAIAVTRCSREAHTCMRRPASTPMATGNCVAHAVISSRARDR
eukprot:3172357-Prymnesium_polylepis.1